MPVSVRGNLIALEFRFNEDIITRLKAMNAGAKWDPKNTRWTLPASPWHARRIIEEFQSDLNIEMDVMQLANKSQTNRLEGKIRPELYPFQNAGVDFLTSLGGNALLCDEPGLGKTVQALQYLKEQYIRTAIVVCPASVVLKWVDEVHAWTNYTSEALLSGKQAIPHTNILVMSYDIMTRQLDTLLEQKFEFIIFDEFHKIKSHRALRSKAAKKLSKKIPHVIGLSGTPLINKPIELWNILNITDRKAWNNWYHYANRYCKDPQTQMMDGAINLDELSERLETIMIRRMKRDVLDQLPPLTRTRIPVDLIHTKAYRELMNEDPDTIKAMYPEKDCFTNPLEKLTALRRFVGWEKEDAAVEVAEDILTSTEDKIVLYCVHLDVLESLKLKLKTWGTTSITGDLSQEKRHNRIEVWQTMPNLRVMLITSAGGEGINLFSRCQRECSRMIFVEREWTSAAEEQAEARLDRIGQTSPVEALYLVVQGTIDEQMDALIDQKRSLIDMVVGSEDVPTVQQDLISLLTSNK